MGLEKGKGLGTVIVTNTRDMDMDLNVSKRDGFFESLEEED